MTDDIANKDKKTQPNPFSRREFIAATGAGLAAATGDAKWADLIAGGIV